MNQHRMLFVVGAFWVPLSGTIFLHATESFAQVIRPRLPIQEAIQIAERCVIQKKINIKGKHIASVIYHPEPEDARWEITWKSNEMVKGGWFVILVQPDNSCKAQYGE